MLTTVKISENAYQYISGSAHLSDWTIDEVIEDTFENRFDEHVKILRQSVEQSSDNEVHFNVPG